MKLKEEIIKCASDLNATGCEVKVKYQGNKVCLDIFNDLHFTGTEKQILDILYESKKTVTDWLLKEIKIN